MLYFFRSWKESLSLFIPKHAKLFFLITLKSIVQSYKFILLHLELLFAASALLDLTYSRICPNQSIICLLPLLGWFATIFGMYLIIRPSMKRKGWDYYKDNGIKFIYFILFSIVAYCVSYGMLFAASHVVHLTHNIHSYFYALFLPLLLLPILVTFLMPPDLIILYVSPLLTFFILFMLDGDNSFRNILQSIVRAFKMIFYNYPFCIIAFVFFVLCSMGYSMLVVWLLGNESFLLSPILSNALLPIPLCILTNFYVKRLHDQFGLYYPETIKE